MITRSDVDLSIIIANPRTLYHLGRLWWLSQKAKKVHGSDRPSINLGKWKRDLHYLRQEKIVKFRDKFVIDTFIPPFPSRAFDVFVLRGLAWPPGHPLWPGSVNLAITNNCPMNCWHCSRANRVSQPDLPTDEWFRIIEELQSVNVCYLGFTGGEPLLRGDLEKIIKHADDRSVISLATSGYGLTHQRAKELKKAGLFSVFISLDHHVSEEHDKRRGYKGAFDIAVDAVANARSAGIYTIIQTVFTKDRVNDTDFEKMLSLAKELGAHEVRGGAVRPSGRLLAAEHELFLTKQDELMLCELGRKANRSRNYPKVALFEEFESPTMFGCGAGAQHAYIDASGNVYPCDFVPLCFGNVVKEKFTDVWARVRHSLGGPRRICLAKASAGLITPEENQALPLPLARSESICAACKSDRLPDYFG